jgi:hypothetical protein
MMPSNLSRKGPLPRPAISCDEPTLTSFAGLLPLFRFMHKHLKLPDHLSRCLRNSVKNKKFKIEHTFLSFMLLSLGGVHKLTQMEHFRNDPGLRRILRLPKLPSRKVYASALRAVDPQVVKELTALLTRFGCATIPKDSDYILDFDTTSLVAYGTQEGTRFGYIGKGRNRRRYHPIVASIGESGATVNARFRDGSAMKAREQLDFVEESVKLADAQTGGKLSAVRGDAGFFSREVLETLCSKQIRFTIVHPMNSQVKLGLWNIVMKPMEDDPDVSLGQIKGEFFGYPEGVRVVIIRRALHNEKEPPQGKKIDFDPCGRYQAITTNLPADYDEHDVWNFYNHRAQCERVFRDGKQSLGLGWLVGQSQVANEVAFLLRLLARNLDMLFHQYSKSEAKSKKDTVDVGLGYRQTRYYRQPGRLVNRKGRILLRVRPEKLVRKLFGFYGYDMSVNG